MKVSPRWVVNAESEIRKVSLSSDGRYAIAQTSNEAILLDIDRKKECRFSPASLCDVSPSGGVIYYGHESRVTLCKTDGTTIGALGFKERVSSCLLLDQVIIIGTEGGGIYAFKTDGTFMWEARVEGAVTMIVEGGSSILVYQSVKKVTMLDLHTGRTRWTAGTSTSAVLISVVPNGNSFVFTVDGRIIEYNPVGAITWNPRVSSRIISGDVARNGKLLGISDEVSVQLYSEYKTILRRWECNNAILLKISGNGAYIVVGLASGMLVFMDKEENLWTYHSADRITSGAMTPNSNRIVIGASKKVLVFDNALLFEDHIHEIVQKLLVAKHFGTDVENAKSFAKNALEKVKMGEFTSALTMLKAAESASLLLKETSKPMISMIAAVSETFAVNQWTKVMAYVMNTGTQHAADLQMVSLTEGVEVQWSLISALNVEECIYVEFSLRPIKPDISKVELELRFWDYAGKPYVIRESVELPVEEKKRQLSKPIAIFSIGDKSKVINTVRMGIKKPS